MLPVTWQGIMRTLIVFGVVLLVGTATLAEISERTQKKLDAADAAYKAAVEKADNTRFYAIQKATADRVKVLKQALTEATKSGDFDGGSKLKELITAAETGMVRGKPKEAVKFGGHEYMAIKDELTWFSAKRLCEEMGGHLATCETPEEEAFVVALCRAPKTRFGCWIGASNENNQDKWVWVTGSEAVQAANWHHDNQYNKVIAHGMSYWPETDGLNDENLGARMGFVCEWEK